MKMTTTTRIRWALLGTLALALGCAGTGGPPAWVNGERPDGFPERQYVVAVGVGEDLAAAQIAAKGELSRIFEARLDSEIELIDRESVVDGVATQTSDLLDTTRIETDLELQGVEVPRHWRDPSSGDYWALAVLERNTECLRIRGEGRDLETELEAHLRVARGDPNPLVAIRSSVNAVRLGAALDALQGRGRVLGLRCVADRSVTTGRLRAEAADRLARLTFVVRAVDVDPASGEVRGPLPQLREEIESNLSRLGFQVGAAANARVVPIEAHLRLLRVERGTDWIEYRYEGAATVGSPVAGDPATIVVESSGAESHPEASSARLRARRSGEGDLARQLDRRLQAFLEENAAE